MTVEMMEGIYASVNKKQHLTEGDLFVGANGKLTQSKNLEDRDDFSVPDFVKEKFGYDDGDGNLEYDEKKVDASKVDLEKEDECTCPECGKPCDECTCETIEGTEEKPEESNEGFDINTDNDGWLDLNTLKDDEAFAKVIDLISVNFNREAAVEGGTDMDYSVIQVKGVTDKEEIKEIIDLIQGTLQSSSYYVNNYRLNDGNLELKVTY